MKDTEADDRRTADRIREEQMLNSSLDHLDLDEYVGVGDASIRHKGSWLAWSDEGTECAATYFEVPPGCHLGAHVHDAEEAVVILEGEATATLEGSSNDAEGPSLLIMPRGKKHDIANTGSGTLRAIGYFPAPSVTTHWEVRLQPGGSHVTGSPDRTS